MDRIGLNPISPFNGPFNGQQKNGPLIGANDGLKSVTCEQTLGVRLYGSESESDIVSRWVHRE